MRKAFVTALRHFLAASAVHEAANVFHALRVSFAEVFAGALVFGEQRLGPEEVNEAPVAGEFLHRLFVAGDVAALLAEDVEEGVPERFRLGLLARLVLPFFGEGNGAVFDFVPGKRHALGLMKSRGSVTADCRTAASYGTVSVARFDSVSAGQIGFCVHGVLFAREFAGRSEPDWPSEQPAWFTIA